MTFTNQVFKCSKCNEDIYLDNKVKSKRGINIPLDPGTGKYHKCKTTIHKRKGMLRVCTRTQIGYYKILGIYPGATAAEIEEAYNTRVRNFHPDVNKSLLAKPLYDKLIEARNNIRLIRVVED